MINQLEPWIDHNEIKELKRIVDSTYVTEAKLTEEFEAMTKDLTGAKHAIAMSNGTVAIYCALQSLGIGKEDEVIVPDLTFIATANAVLMAGAKPIFCDVYEDTFCIDIEKAEKLINKNTKVLIPVHLYGQSADMTKINSLAKQYNLFVIEDAAQGVGVKFLDRHVGTYGDIGVLSYYGNKTITCGEGGMILTSSDELAEKCYMLKNHGRPEKGVFIHKEIGYNFSFTEMQAAVGIAQMKKLPLIISKKKEIYDYYIKKLSKIESLTSCFIDHRCEPVYWITSFLTDDKDNLAEYLLDKNIQTRDIFYPLHLQPCYGKIDIKFGKYPVSEKIYNKGISLPSSYSLTYSQLEYITINISNYFS